MFGGNSFGSFDPENVSKEDMKKIAHHIETYIDQLEGIMVIPDELIDEYGKQIKEGLVIVRKLIKKLKKGDKSVFKDIDEESIFNDY